MRVALRFGQNRSMVRFRTFGLGTPREDWPMKKMVARLNIENFRHLLETETDPAKRQALLRLLAEEEATLQAMTKPEEKKAASGYHEPSTVDSEISS
jgi:hypothetical protein